MNADAKLSSEAAHVAIVPGHCVRESGEPARVTVPRPAGSFEPLVELVRDGDVIRTIDVTCSCGKRMRLKCIY